MGRRKVASKNYDDPNAANRRFKYVSENDVVFTEDLKGIRVEGRRIESYRPGYESADRSYPITEEVRSLCTQRALDVGRFNIRYFSSGADGKKPDKEFDYIPEDSIVMAFPSSCAAFFF